MENEKQLIARVNGITGNVTVRGFVKLDYDRQVCCVSTSDGQILYVDTQMVSILEV